MVSAKLTPMPATAASSSGRTAGFSVLMRVGSAKMPLPGAYFDSGQAADNARSCAADAGDDKVT